MSSKLSTTEIAGRLAETPGWQVEGANLVKHFQFLDFVQALAFVNSVGLVAEEANHHPDIFIQYGKVTLSLRTHSEDAITEKDFALAKAINIFR